MNDVCPLLLCCPSHHLGFFVLWLSVLKLSYDEGESVIRSLHLRLVEDSRFVVAARIGCRIISSEVGKGNAVPPYPAELGVGGGYLPSDVVCTLYGILDYVRIGANIVDVVLEAFVLCNRLIGVIAVIGQPLEPVVRGLENKTSGTALVKK